MGPLDAQGTWEPIRDTTIQIAPIVPSIDVSIPPVSLPPQDHTPGCGCAARRPVMRNSQDLWIGVSRDLLIITL
jgi:hypothetical protein